MGTVIGYSDAQITTFIAGLTGTAVQKRAALKAKLETLRGDFDAARDGNGLLITSGQLGISVNVTNTAPPTYEVTLS